MSKKYRLLKDLPITLAGTIFVPKEFNSSVYKPENCGWLEEVPEEIVTGCPEWFEKVKDEPVGEIPGTIPKVLLDEMLKVCNSAVSTINQINKIKRERRLTEPAPNTSAIKEEDSKGCDICGGKLAIIRGRYPNDDKREVCPTCATEKLESIHDLSNKDYGKTYTN